MAGKGLVKTMNGISSEPIAHGRTAEIFLWDDKHILKLYHTWCPPHWIEDEARIAHAIHTAGIPSPAAGEILEVRGRRGLIYERIDGISMLREVNARPWVLFKQARSLSELQLKIHQHIIPGLPSYKDQLRYAINKTPHLTEILRNKVLSLLESLPNGQTLCHGDYHPGNVLLGRDEPVVIDWMTACSGSPWADVARSHLILTIGPKGAGNLMSPLLRIMIRLFHRTYQNRYMAVVPDKGNELKHWIPVLAAARLNEEIAPEREALLELVEKA